jgi:DNA sulfur modification protein DndE
MNIPQRVVLSTGATENLRRLAAKVQLLPNVTARFALIASLNQSHTPALDNGPAGLTINRVTLFGDLETFLMTALFAKHKVASDMSIARLISAHINRGVNHLQLRVDSLFDIAGACVR